MYVDVQQPAVAVYLCIWDKQFHQCDNYFQMQPMGMDGYKVYWRTQAFNLDSNRYFFYFGVNVGMNYTIYDLHHRRKPKQQQKMDGSRSVYSVFRYDNSNDNITGNFWFARHVYSRLCCGELILKEAVDEYDLIGFGYSNIARRERNNVAHWIQKELAQTKGQPEKVAFLAHVIQHFDWRLLGDDEKSYPLLKDLIQNGDSVSALLDTISCYFNNKEFAAILNIESVKIEDLVASLLCHVQHGRSLEMLIAFVLQVGGGLIDKLSNCKCKFLFSEEDIPFLYSDQGTAFLKDPKVEKLRNKRVFGFIIKKATSPSALLMLKEVLSNTCPSYVTSSPDPFKKAFEKHLASDQLLNKTSWSAIPQEYKSDFVEPYVEALKKAAKLLCCKNEQQEQAIKAFFTDEVALKSEIAMKSFLEIFENLTLSKILSDILQDQTFKTACWNEASDEFKQEVYQRVLSFSPQRQQQGNHVARMFQELDQVFVALDVCPLDNVKESAVEKCRERICTEDINAVVNAFEEIQGLHNDVCTEYYSCLRNSIEKEVKKGQSHSGVIELLKNLPVNDDNQRSKVERYNVIYIDNYCIRGLCVVLEDCV